MSEISSQRLLDIHSDGGPGSSTAAEDGTLARTNKYTVMRGYFAQDEASTNPKTFKFTEANFGLLSRRYDSDSSLPAAATPPTDWQRFYHHLEQLNKDAPAGTSYRLLFLGRHGNGYHNVAASYYGDEAWDCHFSALDGDEDGVMTWVDAHLTAEGIRQAKEVNAFWKNQTQTAGMVLPQAFFVSPLDRAMQTADLTFGDLVPGGFRPTVKELLREGVGIHTCDQRSKVAYIRHAYPHFVVDRDPLLTEHDEFWNKDLREPWDALIKRETRFLDDLFAEEDRTVISCTSHSGAIGALLDGVGHRQFGLATGAVIPVLLKVEKPANPAALPRHFGDGEGPQSSGTSDNPELVDQSEWERIPACPRGMNLTTIGWDNWGMSLKDFLRKIEEGQALDDPALHPR